MARYERKEITAELVLAWDHKGAFKGGHLVRWDVVRDGAELVSARQLAAEPIAGALQPGLAIAEVLSTVQLDLARGLDAATRELTTAREELQTTRAALAGAEEELGEVRAAATEATGALEAKREELEAARAALRTAEGATAALRTELDGLRPGSDAGAGAR